MSVQIPNYLEIIAEKFPSVEAYAFGAARDYDNIRAQGNEPVPPKADLDAAGLLMTKDRVWQQIKEKRSAVQEGGVQLASNGKWFHSDQPSRIQQIGLVMMGASMPSGIMWKTMDDTFVEMTPAIAMEIFNTIAAHDLQAFAVAEQHKAAMMASASPETYDFSSNWPATFSG